MNMQRNEQQTLLSPVISAYGRQYDSWRAFIAAEDTTEYLELVRAETQGPVVYWFQSEDPHADLVDAYEAHMDEVDLYDVVEVVDLGDRDWFIRCCDRKNVWARKVEDMPSSVLQLLERIKEEAEESEETNDD